VSTCYLSFSLLPRRSLQLSLLLFRLQVFWMGKQLPQP
jgi:hypothetical protein